MITQRFESFGKLLQWVMVQHPTAYELLRDEVARAFLEQRLASFCDLQIKITGTQNVDTRCRATVKVDWPEVVLEIEE